GGGGLAGRAGGGALAVRGHAVRLLEASGEVGGHARRVETAGARIDVGPTLLVDLAPLRALFGAAGLRLEDAVALARLDPGLVATFGAGGGRGRGPPRPPAGLPPPPPPPLPPSGQRPRPAPPPPPPRPP